MYFFFIWLSKEKMKNFIIFWLNAGTVHTALTHAGNGGSVKYFYIIILITLKLLLINASVLLKSIPIKRDMSSCSRKWGWIF